MNRILNTELAQYLLPVILHYVNGFIGQIIDDSEELTNYNNDYTFLSNCIIYKSKLYSNNTIISIISYYTNQHNIVNVNITTNNRLPVIITLIVYYDCCHVIINSDFDKCVIVTNDGIVSNSHT